MNCDECQPLLEEFFDGEADEPIAAQAQAHLDACAACARAFEGLRREEALYLRYEFDAAPAPDFWGQVFKRTTGDESADLSFDAATRAPSSHAPGAFSETLKRIRRLFAEASGLFAAPRFSPTLTAALVVVSVALTIGVMRYLNSREEAATRAENPAANQIPSTRKDASDATLASNGTGDVRASDAGRQVAEDDGARAQEDTKSVGRGVAPHDSRPEDGAKRSRAVLASRTEGGKPVAPHASSSLEQTPDELVREAEQKYIAAIGILARDVRRNRTRLDAQAITRFEQTLAMIDRTIAGTRDAVRRHPGDPVAVNYMLTAYAKKVEVLREMARY